MSGWNEYMSGWHWSSGWTPVSVVVIAGLIVVLAWAILRAKGIR